jgi:hypothetical protein
MAGGDPHPAAPPTASKPKMNPADVGGITIIG